MNDNTNNKRRAMARIHWVSPAAGGRAHPPRGPRYSTVAKFEREVEKWPKEAWSIVAEFKKISDDLSNVIAEVRCLAPDALRTCYNPAANLNCTKAADWSLTEKC